MYGVSFARHIPFQESFWSVSAAVSSPPGQGWVGALTDPVSAHHQCFAPDGVSHWAWGWNKVQAKVKNSRHRLNRLNKLRNINPHRFTSKRSRRFTLRERPSSRSVKGRLGASHTRAVSEPGGVRTVGDHEGKLPWRMSPPK